MHKKECPDIQDVCSLYLAGLSSVNIAAKYGVSAEVIRRWLREAEIPVRKKGAQKVSIVNNTKLCSSKHGCGQLKSTECFSKHKNGFSAICKTCRNEFRQTKEYKTQANNYNRLYYTTHKELSRAKKALRRQRAIHHLSRKDVLFSAKWRVRIKGNPCFYCGQHKEIMHDDHAIPLARGGTDHWYNLVRACADCNRRKGSKTATEFIETLKSLGG